MSSLRKEVLKTFKKLHRTRMISFNGDEHALNTVRNAINKEFQKNKHVSNQESIAELNKFALEVENEIRTTVVQAVQKEAGVFQLNIRKDHLVDNVPLPGTPLSKPQRQCGLQKPKKNTG